MFVGVLRLTFHIAHARSLKDKRRVVQKLRDRIRSRFDVSIAEVGAQDFHQRAVFGVSVVSSDAAVCDSVLEQVARAAEMAGDAVLTDRATELVTIGDDLFGGESGGLRGLDGGENESGDESDHETGNGADEEDIDD